VSIVVVMVMTKKDIDRPTDQPTTHMIGWLGSAADAVFAETRWIVSGSALAYVLWRRDGDAAALLLGAIANAYVCGVHRGRTAAHASRRVLGKALKRLVKQARPPQARHEDPGMPSSHATSLLFFAVSAATGGMRAGLPGGGACAVVLLACAAAAWRVRAGLHTPAQVVVGALLGTVDALLWGAWAQPHVARLLDGHPRTLGAVLVLLVVAGARVITARDKVLG
jgi:membrane-associated phospholipid phosphatase